MSFLAPFLLLGSLFAAVPLIIHLLNRPRYKLEAWGAMMFLRAAAERRRRRIKAEQLLLMLVRMLALALIAIALARPVMRASNMGAGDQATSHMLVIDGSYSMHQGEHRDNAFEKARTAALEIVEAMNPSDNAMVVWAGNKPSALTPRPLFSKSDVRRCIEVLEPGWERADMPRAIEHAIWLQSFSTLPRQRVYVLTDGQAHGWDADAERTWADLKARWDDQKVPTHVYALGQSPEESIVNVAVSGIRSRYGVVDTHRAATFIAEIHNYSEDPQLLDVAFSADGRDVERRSLSLQPGVNTAEFSYRFFDPGSHVVAIDIWEDGLPVDNRRVLALEVQNSVPVLLIEGASGGNAFASDGEMLAWALAAGGSHGSNSLISVERIKQTEMDQLDFGQLLRFKTLVLANVSSLSSSLINAIERFVQDGGGLLVGLGGQVNVDAYNSMADLGVDLMPARLGDLARADGRPLHPSFAGGKATDILNLFDVSRTRKLTNVRIETFYESIPHENTEVIGYVDEKPFLMIKPFGQGSVVLWTSSLGLEWSNFAATPDYVPLVQNLVLHLSSQVVPPVNLAQGETLAYSYSRARAQSHVSDKNGVPPTCVITTPGGETHVVAFESKGGESVAFWSETLRPGVYTVATDGVDPRYYAVGLPPDEGKFTPLAARQTQGLKRAFPLSMHQRSSDLFSAIASEVGVRDFSYLFIWLALLTLVGDLIMSWRFSG